MIQEPRKLPICDIGFTCICTHGITRSAQNHNLRHACGVSRIGQFEHVLGKVNGITFIVKKRTPMNVDGQHMELTLVRKTCIQKIGKSHKGTFGNRAKTLNICARPWRTHQLTANVAAWHSRFDSRMATNLTTNLAGSTAQWLSRASSAAIQVQHN